LEENNKEESSHVDELSLANLRIRELQRRLFDVTHAKSRKRHSDVSFDQVTYDREDGVRIPSLIRESEELSIMSSPTVMEGHHETTSVSSATPLREPLLRHAETETANGLEAKILELEQQATDLTNKYRTSQEKESKNKWKEGVSLTQKELSKALDDSERTVKAYEKSTENSVRE
jgi:hypothetical protein